MSAQENTQLVQRAYQQIQTGDIPSFLKLLHADVRWRLPKMENVPFSGTWQGRESVGQFFAKLAEVHEIVEFEPQQYIAQGDKVVVLGHFVMLVKPTGIKVASDWAHVWTVQHGEVTDFCEYVDTGAVRSAHAAATKA